MAGSHGNCPHLRMALLLQMGSAVHLFIPFTRSLPMDKMVNEKRPEVLRALLIGRRTTLQKEIDHLIAQHRDNSTHFRDNSVLDVEDMSLRDATGSTDRSVGSEDAGADPA